MEKVKHAVLTVSLFYVILYLTLMLFVFYTPFIETFHAEQQTQLLFDEDISFYRDNLLTFLLGEAPLVNDGFYSQREYDHMQDVQELFVIATWLFSICLIVSLLLYKSVNSTKYVKRVLLFIFPVIVIIGFFFERAFIVFHHLVFRNDLWLLPADSSLIRMFPETFFLQITLYVSIIVVIIHVFLLLFFKIHTHFTRK